MADEKTKTPPPAPQSGTVRVDLVNPTPARRIIHDGIPGSHKAIVVEPGETKANVEIHDSIAKELRARTRPRGKEKADLLVYSAGKAPVPGAATDDEDDGDE